MQLRDTSFPDPRRNIDYDDVLLTMAQRHGAGEYLRFWESQRLFVVLGRIGKLEADVNVEAARLDGVPVLRRTSGGGTVVQGPGCLNYTLVLSRQKHPQVNDLHQSYLWITAKVIAALEKCGVTAFFKPISDLATGPDEKKFSGNAQRRCRNFILHHGTILYDFSLPLISRYLSMPRDIPEYRRLRRHADFVTNVSLDPRAFKTHLAAIMGACAPLPPSEQELSMLFSR